MGQTRISNYDNKNNDKNYDLIWLWPPISFFHKGLKKAKIHRLYAKIIIFEFE